MRFTRGKKIMLAGIITGALLAGLCGNAAYDIAAVNAGEQAPPLPSEETAAPLPTPAGYQDVAGIPVTPGAISVNDSLAIDEMAFVENTATSVTLSWVCGALQDGIYYIYRYNEDSMEYEYVGSSRETSYVCSGLKPAKKYYFTVCAFDEVNKLQGRYAYPVGAYTRPKKVQNLSFIDNKQNTIELEWDAVPGADGYIIYHAEGSGNFEEAGKTTETTFLDEGLLSGKNYRYKVRAYVFYKDNRSAASEIAKMTTLPAKPAVMVKGGDKKARISWNAVTGAAGYYLYWYNGTEYQYLEKLKGKNNTEYLHKGLENGVYSQYKVEAYRVFKETEYKSGASDMRKDVLSKQDTVTAPKLFKNKKIFKKSSAYLLCKEFKKTVNYEKSFVIPGVSGTDVDGFYSKNMCPQGITFAKSYLLLSSYDRKKEENSVVYVMDKQSRKLVMTIVLPNKTHAGGLAYDGENLWVTQTDTVRSIPFDGIEDALAEGKKEYLASYNTICKLTHTAGSLTYYKKKLWVASYDELASGYLGVYSINQKSSSPELEEIAVTRVPSRVQGLTFADGGKLVLSRSCQTNAAQRSFLHVLDIYKPNLKKLSDGIITLGKVKKTVDMPSMNEEIAVSGKYLYVNFESAAFSTAVKRMDRVCALKVSSIVSWEKDKKLKTSSLKKLENPGLFNGLWKIPGQE
ncbi:hypothetical protein D7V86_01150 [bacterium D16-51]|nr:hypothetical protein D7V96_04170 [bacterium D16-59]RKI62839.1 hypothetical protein D7V86_01150 [bacterium D16-51]